MRTLLFIVAVAYCVWAKAQSPEIDSLKKAFEDKNSLIFNKRFYEIEGSWVVLPGSFNPRDNLIRYNYGFVYFETGKGYRLTEAGQFLLDQAGRVTTRTFSYQYPLNYPSSKVSSMPGSVREMLKLPTTPDGYTAIHQETRKLTVQQKLSEGNVRLSAHEASVFVGIRAYVSGNVFKTEIRRGKTGSDTVTVLEYMGDPEMPRGTFLMVRKLDPKKDAEWLQRLEKASLNPQNFDKKEFERGFFGEGIEGRIILFEGKPAIISNEIFVNEPVG